MNAPDERRPARVFSDAELDANERAYNAGMAKLTAERGYLNLSQAHALAAQDCGRGCPCEGCRMTRLEREAERAAKQARASRTRRVIA